MKLSRDQARALKSIIHWYRSKDKKQFITLGGYAGTGKTTLIAMTKDSLVAVHENKKRKMKIALCSYTGRATQNLKSKLNEHTSIKWNDKVSTIHGLIYDPIENSSGVIIGWKKKPEIDVDLIVIDESSMIDENIWNDLLSFNVPIIAVGDHGQLPPIKGSFNLMRNPDLKLENIHRQAAENPIIKISINAREEGGVKPGKYGDNVIKYSQDDYDYDNASKDLLENYSEDMLILCGYNSTRVKINQFVRNALGFDFPEPRMGDRVICLRNNHNQNIYNGMLGTIKSIAPFEEAFYDAEIKMDEVEKNYVGKIYAPQFNSTEPINFTKDRAKIGDSDLFDFGYALTVHKAQGSQAPKVVLFEERFSKMDDDQWKRWLYTGITRAQNELYLFGKA
jgi:exodeoxyribonuclease-5